MDGTRKNLSYTNFSIGRVLIWIRVSPKYVLFAFIIENGNQIYIIVDRDVRKKIKRQVHLSKKPGRKHFRFQLRTQAMDIYLGKDRKLRQTVSIKY